MFLPGASGNTRFWQPVAERLSHAGSRRFLGWPGFGDTPADERVRSTEDLVARVVAELTAPVVLCAQSMGGSIALRVALQKPELVSHLVLSATSGGLDVSALGGTNWRPWFREAFPHTPRWFDDERIDLSERLSQVQIPVLLLWGDADPISPVAVGERLAQLLPHATLVVIAGGTHDVACERADEVAPLIERHLAW